jgi:hypothetical protein
VLVRIVGELDLIVGSGKFFRNGVKDKNDSVMMDTERKWSKACVIPFQEAFRWSEIVALYRLLIVLLMKEKKKVRKWIRKLIRP